MQSSPSSSTLPSTSFSSLIGSNSTLPRGSIVKKATIKDIKEIDRLNRASLKENYDQEFYDTFFALQNSSNFVIYARDVEGDQGGTSGDRIAAYILSAAQMDNQQKMHLHVFSIAVDPLFQRKGFATMLLNAIEKDTMERFRGVRYISLHCRKSTNKGAYLFYCKNKFNNAKTVKKYYMNPVEDALLMKKSLI